MAKLDFDLSRYVNVFCDSKEALEWAYSEGLSKDAVVITSSPAILFSKIGNFRHLEKDWTPERTKYFLKDVEKYSIDIYDSVRKVINVSHEEALCITRQAIHFDRTIFRAACLTQKDLTLPTLVLNTKSKDGKFGGKSSTPWGELLKHHAEVKVISYILKKNLNSNFSSTSKHLLDRVYLGGVETLVYRLASIVNNKFNLYFFNKQIVIHRENELIIDISYNLIKQGARVTTIASDLVDDNCILYDTKKVTFLYESIITLIRKRYSLWVIRELSNSLDKIFFNNIEKSLNIFQSSYNGWEKIARHLIEENRETVLLSNAVCCNNGLGMTRVFRKYGIPVVSAQHGISAEISETQRSRLTRFDINNSDCNIVFNNAMKKVNDTSYFSSGKTFVSGISVRHLRMSKKLWNMRLHNYPPIVFVSTNLFKGDIGPIASWLTDYDRALKESEIIETILAKLPYRVMYKTYPQDNFRYSDIDPNIENIKNKDNLELFDQKVDMRFLVKRHRILITTGATSTLSWLVLSNKPVVFIIWRGGGELLEEVHEIFKCSLFVFYNDQYKELHEFLSQPLEKIEEAWIQKEDVRNRMIKEYFTTYRSNAGKRAAKMILNEFF